MGVQLLGPAALYFGKKGVKKLLEIHRKSQQNRAIQKNYGKGTETDKSSMTNRLLKNKSDLHSLVKDKHVIKTVKKLIKRNEANQKRGPQSYIQKKLNKNELSKFKNGKFVKVKCKLGRNKPTKLM